MENEYQISLEKALKRTEEDVESTLKAANAVLDLLKRLHAATNSGDLKEIKKGVDSIDQAINALRQQFVNTKEGWDLDEESYLREGFAKELLKTASEAGLSIFEQDDRLFCYPVLLKMLPQERAVLIDKVRERKIRPSVLINLLKQIQTKPIRFNPDSGKILAKTVYLKGFRAILL